MTKSYARTRTFVPIISKSEFDLEATRFLKEFYPCALLKPMAVPILNIAKQKMNLKIIDNLRLSEDFSVLGKMCFTSGRTEVYYKDEDEFRDIKVEAGTMLIDPDVLEKRNIGCLNNTIAHECYQWYKHRLYHLNQHFREKFILYANCHTEIKPENSQNEWTDEDWMEWQASGIAPRILMPKSTFIKKANELLNKYKQDEPPNWWLVNDLANFFKVSKWSAQIRLEELNIMTF